MPTNATPKFVTRNKRHVKYTCGKDVKYDAIYHTLFAITSVTHSSKDQ